MSTLLNGENGSGFYLMLQSIVLFYYVKKLSRRRPGFADTLLHEYWNISVKEKNFVYDLLQLLLVYLCKTQYNVQHYFCCDIEMSYEKDRFCHVFRAAFLSLSISAASNRRQMNGSFTTTHFST